MTVYRGDCDALVCVVGNDDSCGLQAGLTWQTEADTDYFIVVHGFIGASGDFTMFVVDLGAAAAVGPGRGRGRPESAGLPE